MTALAPGAGPAPATAGRAYRLGPLQQIPLGEGRVFGVAGTPVAVFRPRPGGVYATQAACPHRGGPLADGILGDGPGGPAVVCPLHLRTFDLASGAQAGPSGADCLATYPVEVGADGGLLLYLPGAAGPAAPIPPETTPVHHARSGDHAAADAGSLLDRARATGRCWLLLEVIDVAGFAAKLRRPGPFTLLAPPDEALAGRALAGTDRAGPPTDPALAREVVRRHVVSGAYRSAELRTMPWVSTIGGHDLSVTVATGTIRFGDATVTSADLVAGNGVVHLIDRDLSPGR